MRDRHDDLELAEHLDPVERLVELHRQDLVAIAASDDLIRIAVSGGAIVVHWLGNFGRKDHDLVVDHGLIIEKFYLHLGPPEPSADPIMRTPITMNPIQNALMGLLLLNRIRLLHVHIRQAGQKHLW